MHSSAGFISRLARATIFGIDTIQRRRHHVYEFEKDPRCILRISRCRSREEHILSDGTLVRRDAPVLEIHFWNEHIPLMRSDGPDLGWGQRFCEAAQLSLHDLARYIACTPGLEDIVAIRGETSVAASVGGRYYSSFCRRMGFDFVYLPSPLGAARLGAFFPHLYVWIITWVLNPASLRGKPLGTAQRCELWISRSALLARYGTPAAARSESSQMPTPA